MPHLVLRSVPAPSCPQANEMNSKNDWSVSSSQMWCILTLFLPASGANVAGRPRRRVWAASRPPWDLAAGDGYMNSVKTHSKPAGHGLEND